MIARARLLLVCFFLSSCDDDAEGSADASVPADAGAHVSADASVGLDARVVDASDAGATGCSLDQRYTFGFEGGLIAWTDHFALEQGYLTKSRESTARFDAGNGSCRIKLDRCDDLASAFLSAASAFSDKEEVLGNDPRIVDGSVLVVEREDGKQIIVGSGCNDAPKCTPIPPSVQTLKAALTKLIQDNDFAPADAGAGNCR